MSRSFIITLDDDQDATLQEITAATGYSAEYIIAESIHAATGTAPKVEEQP